MRTLQEKYNGINEGKFSKDQFLRDARMQQPSLITQYNGYDDAVQILKNRGMIQEEIDTENPKDIFKGGKPHAKGVFFSKDGHTFSKSKEGTDSTLHDPNDQVLDAPVKESISQDIQDGAKLKNTLSGAFYTVDGKDETGGIYVRSEKGLRKNIPSKYFDAYEIVEEVNEARLTKSNLTDYRYKPTNDMDKYPYEQILRGLRVELEGLDVLGTPTPEEYTKALAKVLKNLEKDSIFYTNQVAGIKANKKRTDLMIDATTKTVVDKENGLQKAALKEAIKGVIKNILSENTDCDYDDADDVSHPLGYEDQDEDIYEMQSGKSDSEYKSELADYLEDNQIYGYTDMIHDIMTGSDEEENSASLVDFLDDHQIYGYNRGIERIFADYPYDQHWQNQPDSEDEGVGLSPEIFESISLFDILDEGSSKHSTEWFKGYRAFNDDKQLKDNPNKENPKKEDWKAGWEQAKSDEKKNN